jgi:HSP20 family molecular chaperone IbpA
VDHEVKAMEKMIHQQRNEFTERFGKAEEVNRETLRNQQETYLKALYKQKLRLDEKISTEKKRENDPFYAMKSFDAKLTEDQLNYTLRARIAPHERDNVEVRVKDDKVVLSARRQYEDSTKDKNSRLTTNSYQTHRQEFHLPIPVDQKRALKRIDDEGFITVVMPKKGYGKLA